MTAPRFLEGVRVIDLSQYIPGPFATRQLADLGADVIKIEPPAGDPMRRFMATKSDEPSAIYRHVNRGKRVCRLDLKQEHDRRKFSELLRDADILLESYRPGVLARLGFDRERLGEINARLIHCALSGFGQTGPWAPRAGHDINYCAVAGQSIGSGTGERPIIAYPPIADHAGAMQAAVAMLAALHGRRDNATGTFLDVSITESILAWQYLPALGGGSQRAATILNGGAACYNIYRCADGAFISVGAIETSFWKNFCTALRRPDWIARQYETMPQVDLIAAVAEEIGEHPADYWHRLLDSVDCCYAPLLEPNGLSANPQFSARRSCSEDGPAYPAWINDARLAVERDIDATENPATLRWKDIG
jgi:crotonobetainyl-CoA:carnitine CoA-transferase CaiB-like acyl-CoA transferase